MHAHLTGHKCHVLAEVEAYLEDLEESSGNGKLSLVYVKLHLSWLINSL